MSSPNLQRFCTKQNQKITMNSKRIGKVAFLLCMITFVVKGEESAKKGCGSRSSKKLRYLLGDAINDDPNCIGLHGQPYPKEAVERLLSTLELKGQGRQGRMMFSHMDDKAKVMEMRNILLKSYGNVNGIHSIEEAFERVKREVNDDSDGKNKTKGNMVLPGYPGPPCAKSETPSRLCKSSFNTTAPMYGVSLTSGNPVTIVQKFPDLLQQVVYETCDRSECEVLHGECVQTYIPYLFLVIPLGPVTLTGQDYVLVESGCTCRPKYAGQSEPDPLSIIPNFA